MKNKLNSWDILSMYFYRWKIFAVTFAITIVFSAILISIGEKNKQKELSLQLEAQKLEQEKLKAEHKKALEIYEMEMANRTYYSFYLHIKNIDKKPLISQNLLNEILQDSMSKFSLSISTIEHNIFKLTFPSNNKKEAKMIQKVLIKELDSANIVQFIQSSISQAKDGIFVFGEVYNDKQVMILKPKPPVFTKNNNEMKEKDFIQTSFRSKIILAFISAFIFGSIAVFTMEFWEANKHKLKR